MVPALPPTTKGLAVGPTGSACIRVRLLAGDSASKGRWGEQFGSPQVDGEPSSIPSRVRLIASIVSDQAATSTGRPGLAGLARAAGLKQLENKTTTKGAYRRATFPRVTHIRDITHISAIAFYRA
mmetsp:Transcript_7095/g.23319  ORF Transcript_7095/g.23319 Transcript_7095/m.23319 type:complete len:125 (-) Transcript_7095:2285-2659(-)